MTRKVILFVTQTLDGYIADAGGNIDFLWNSDFTNGDSADKEYEKFAKRVDTVVMGRHTYNQIVNDMSPNNYPYADYENYVMTTHPLDDADNIHFINGKVAEVIQNLKEESSKRDIWIIGGSNVIAPLVNADLIDIYHIGVVPVVLGKGIPLFSDAVKFKELSLNSVKKVNEIVYLEYVK
ncbi:dihydrofolate reductase family protein [Companilactobacillus halodurans]|uniref:Dihydrofolate reductase n=1 Tax=Companilactobacillus halodurans TaxID=2584183 RepID=A0A5P0ZPM2_9LACO|nr:dihydrofolate reductase family protein [Companilactobacillus halodurans]MQS76193.1 dihydrofolate reductase [Companilactobacillus halodurans]MQS97421.1 dihydrofolate reductase [Companilactobacillus halodurans]